MKNIFEEAFEIQRFLRRNNLSFCFIGGLALQRWGELRTTNDIDLTIYTSFKDEEKVIDSLLVEYESRIPDAKEMAFSARILLLKGPSGIGIDIALGGMTFEESTIMRASEGEYLPGISLLTCSAEDLIVHKTFASRPKDWIDIEGIILRQTQLDWGYIESQLKPILSLKEEPEQWDKLIAMKNRLTNEQ